MSAYDSSSHHAVQSLIEEFAAAARRVHVSDDFKGSMARITATAKESIGGCEAASISLLTEERPVTFGATDPLADQGDAIQYAENEGPCMDAAMQETWVSTPDLADNPRWPRSAARLHADLGVRSMFSCRLTLDSATHQPRSGLTLYATVPGAFSTQDQHLAILLASLGAVVVDAARQQEGLRAAIQTRQVIGEAIGILRAKSNLNSEQAFERLSKASQRTNVKVRDLARQIAEGSRSGREPV